MKLDEQCGMCHSFTWCGRMCRHAPTIYEAPGLAEKPAEADPVPAAVRVAKTRKARVKAAEPFDKVAYQRNYMRKKRAKPV